MEKRNYIVPEMEIVKMETAAVLAASVRIGEGEVAADQSFSNERRGGWGDLWE